MRPARGMTLLEAIVAGFILIVATFSLLNLYPLGRLAVRRGEQTLQADNLASSILSQQRGRPFSELEPATLRPDPVRIGGTEYRVRVDIASPVEGSSDLRAIRVTVTWEFRGRRELVQEVWVHRAMQRSL